MNKSAPSVRQLCLQILEQTFQNGSYADDLLERTFERHALKAMDRNLLTELVYGTLRWHGQLEWLLSRYFRGDFQASPRKLRLILELSLYQLRFLNKIPAYAAVNEGVNLARQSGGRVWAGLVNGILRSYLRDGKRASQILAEDDPVRNIAINYSHPEWMVSRWVERYGEEATRLFCEFNNRRPSLSIRVNSMLISANQLLQELQDAGFDVSPGAYFDDFLTIANPQGLLQSAAFKSGRFAIQDESTALPALLLKPEAGNIVLDLCAAPGGKASHLAHLMGDSGAVVAVDRSETRMDKLRQNLQRFNLKSLLPVVADGRNLQVKNVDKILIDAPCSGLGVLARRADLRWKRQPEDILKIREVQQSLLENAAQLLGKNGILVYSTCTIEPEENEELIEEFLARHQEFIVDSEFSVPGKVERSGDGYWKTLPWIHKIDGTFAVRLMKTE